MLLRKMLKRHEGVSRFAYRCSSGKTTIGCGRNIDEAGGLGLSEDEIDFILDNDIIRCIKELSVAFPWFGDMDEVRQDAMVSICFNLGLTKLLLFKKAIAAMEDGDYKLASVEFLDSKWASQVGIRATELSQMILSGNYAEVL